jgi:predicted nuclease of predicted toxin-antitoxin system
MFRLLTDEDFNHNILRGLIRRVPHLDYVLVHDVGLTSQPDPVLLKWAASNHRIIITHDDSTMVPHAKQLIRQGEPMAGLILVPQSLGIGRAIDDLELIVHCYSESEMRDRIERLPL